MSSESKKPEDMTAYERWELPTLGDSNPKPKGFVRPSQKTVKPLTAKDLEEIRQQGYQDGLQQGRDEGFKEGFEQGEQNGHQEGYAAGMAQAKQEIQNAATDAVERLEKMLEELLDPVAQQRQQYEQALTNLSLALSRAVIHRELHTDSAVIEQTVSEILDSLPKFSKGISIACHGIDLPFVQQAIEKLNVDVEVRLQQDIHPGGCRVETSSQVVDFTIEKRFQKTVQAMLMNASGTDSESTAESPQTLQEHTEYPSELLDEPVEALKTKSPNTEPVAEDVAGDNEGEGAEENTEETSELDQDTEAQNDDEQKDD